MKSIRLCFVVILTSIVSLNFVVQSGKAQKAVDSESSSPPFMENSHCAALGGMYAFHGEALPGMPSYFRVKAIPLTFDVMLGFELPPKKSDGMTGVEVVQDRGIDLAFYKVREMVIRTVPYEAGDSVRCDNNTLIIKKSRHTSGEAVRSVTDITHMLSIDESRALIITTEITGQSKSLFFSYSKAPEIYGARFRRLAE